MEISIVYTFGIALMFAVAVLGLFVWGVSGGAFEHVEDAKYVLFRDDEDE